MLLELKISRYRTASKFWDSFLKKRVLYVMWMKMKTIKCAEMVMFLPLLEVC